jgi:outer membrane lipoprotein-sorting protein
VSIEVWSAVFDDIDTSFGFISIGNDNRYLMRINKDIYAFDGELVWEYSADNNQATYRSIKGGEVPADHISFIKNLDNYYDTDVFKPDSIYGLFKKDQTDDALPDSMTVFLDSTGGSISHIEYYDLNDDLNNIRFLELELLNAIDPASFKINLPDSVEIISLP